MKPLGRRDDLELQRVDDELVVYDLRNDKAHCLHPVTARVWELSMGDNSVTDLVSILQAEGHQEADEDLVWLALDALGDADLLAEKLTPPGGTGSVSRRKMIRDLAAAGALASMPFAIKSIITPTPAAAQSGPPEEPPEEKEPPEQKEPPETKEPPEQKEPPDWKDCGMPGEPPQDKLPGGPCEDPFFKEQPPD